jgi:hypothetical protein
MRRHDIVQSMQQARKKKNTHKRTDKTATFIRCVVLRRVGRVELMRLDMPRSGNITSVAVRWFGCCDDDIGNDRGSCSKEEDVECGGMARTICNTPEDTTSLFGFSMCVCVCV